MGTSKSKLVRNESASDIIIESNLSGEQLYQQLFQVLITTKMINKQLIYFIISKGF